MNMFVEMLNKQGYEVTEMKDRYRINGVVDVIKWDSLRLYDNMAKTYISCKDLADKQKTALDLLEKYPKQEAYKKKKKTEKGRMTYKEFKNRMWNSSKK